MAALVLCGCDQLFGLDVIDSPAVDAAGPDAAEPVLGNWTAASALPVGRDYNHSHAAFLRDTLYMIGGVDVMNGGESDVVYRAPFVQGVLGEWTQTTSLPAPRALGDVVTVGDRIYVVGGANGAGAQTTVYVVEPDSTGNLSTWSSVSPLPVPRKAHAAAAANNYLYAFGGGDVSNIRQTSVYYAPIRSDGSLGSWQVTAALPGPRANLAGVAARGFLYAIGGDESDSLSHATVFYAPLDATDGHVGSWSTTTALPGARKGLVAVTDGMYIYVIGGVGTAATAEVHYSQIAEDGSLGAWEATAPLLMARYRHAGVLANGQLFVLGGATTPTSVEHAVQGPR